jgi:hypothetical protein
MKTSKWTPEQIIQAFKEFVTAVIGVMILLFTLILSTKVFDYFGDQQKMSDAKDVLLLLLGMAGIVVGYYFGRVPADARTTQAQKQANQATAQAEQVGAQAQSAADQMDLLLSRMAPSLGTDSRSLVPEAAGKDVASEMKRIRDTLRQTANASR